ncbi:hypothetical protein SLE2022_160340 [Rubroshorea leprosula]
MELLYGFRRGFHNEIPRWLFLVGVVAITHLFFQSLSLSYGNTLRSLFLDGKVQMHGKNTLFVQSSTKSTIFHNPRMNLTDVSMSGGVVNDANNFIADGVVKHGSGFKAEGVDIKNSFQLVGTKEDDMDKQAVVRNIDDGFASKSREDPNESSALHNVKDQEIISKENSFDSEGVREDDTNKLAMDRIVDDSFVSETHEDQNESSASDNTEDEDDISNENNFDSEEAREDETIKLVVDKDLDNGFTSKNHENLKDSSASHNIRDQENISNVELNSGSRDSFTTGQVMKTDHEISTDMLLENKTSQMPKEVEHVNTASQPPSFTSEMASSMNNTNSANSASNAGSSGHSASVLNDFVNSRNNSAVIGKPGRKSVRSEMPPKLVTTIDEMNQILLRHRWSLQSMVPQHTSVRDQEIFAARSQIENAPSINDQELYAPVFRNVSMFKRSYELMERTLKVYVYKDGSKPIFHQPVLKGLYASEGWFMKLMQGNKHFVVKDPRKAHLFYMPFSSRMLQYTLYDHNSHDWTNLQDYLKDYTEKIAARYPYWNRTGGTDHFLVACHDWAPFETKHHMDNCIKALCNADVTVGFKIGRDISLPETFIRSAKNPLRTLGGKPPSRRHILAFYAGNNHGYVRPILLKYWKDKDPDMKIFGTLPRGVVSKMNYFQHMKSSKYCICPKGYEVNSPRVVEAIFYECVPVIISDNFVPPFFEVLDWGAFSIILAEKDIPNLKDILLSIPEEKYLEMQLAVRKVQRHFLWHARPEKYDLFHMTLHSIWYNRVYQV